MFIIWSNHRWDFLLSIALRLLSRFLSLEIIFNSVHGYVLYLQLELDRQQDLEQDQNYLKVDDIRCIYQAVWYHVSYSNSYQVQSERNRVSFFLARFSIHAPPSFNYAIKRNERVPVSVRVRRGAAVGHDEIIVIELSKRIRPVILRGLNLNRGWKESYVPLDSRRIVSRGNYRVLYRTGRTSR